MFVQQNQNFFTFEAFQFRTLKTETLKTEKIWQSIGKNGVTPYCLTYGQEVSF